MGTSKPQHEQSSAEGEVSPSAVAVPSDDSPTSCSRSSEDAQAVLNDSHHALDDDPEGLAARDNDKNGEQAASSSQGIPATIETSKPDPPPSVVDVDPHRDEFFEENDRMPPARASSFVEDENRIQSVVQAALSSGSNHTPSNNHAINANAHQSMLPPFSPAPAPAVLSHMVPVTMIRQSSFAGEPLPSFPEQTIHTNRSDGSEPHSLSQQQQQQQQQGTDQPTVDSIPQQEMMNMDSSNNNHSSIADPPRPPSVIGTYHPPTAIDENPTPIANGGAVMHQPVALMAHPHQQFNTNQSLAVTHPPATTMMVMGGALAGTGGRRKIKLRMEEELPVAADDERGFLRSIRRSALFGSGELSSGRASPDVRKQVDRGTLTISWFEGTSTLELQEHVRNSVIRKLKLPKHIELVDFRVIDESSDPPEDIVLCPYIPNGSQFLLRFTTRDRSKDRESPILPPVSPSAAPSPHPQKGRRDGLDPEELKDLQQKLESMRPRSNSTIRKNLLGQGQENIINQNMNNNINLPDQLNGNMPTRSVAQTPEASAAAAATTHEEAAEDEQSDEDEMVLHSEDPIEARLRQITELLLRDREAEAKSSSPGTKRQVVFTLANYFVLFLSLIAISAEIQARAPTWIASLESQVKNVADCSADKDALFECVSRGDFAGLVASVLLWLSRSLATKKLFLFGFDSPQKLWTVVYECLVTSFCWGFSYLFVRRGLNPDTRSRFVQKYWKDAVYGSLAGFNAAFMKQVLKNFIPQEAVENAMKTQQLKILSWLPHFQD